MANPRSKIPATRTASPWRWRDQSWVHRKLTKSLMCYVSAEDELLTRKQFLNTVCDRIAMDLQTGDQ